MRRVLLSLFVSGLLGIPSAAAQPVTEEVGDPADRNADQAVEAYKMNIYEIAPDSCVHFTGFSQLIDSREGARIDYLFYREDPNQTAAWQLVDVHSEVLAAAQSDYWATSPPLDQVLLGGRRYAVGLLIGNDPLQYYWDDSSMGSATSFGVVVGALRSLPGLVVSGPPPETIFGDPYLSAVYHQTMTTEPLDDCDGDGVTATDGDCDDQDPAVFPGAEETCNRIDDNCDGEVDEGVRTVFLADLDGDGFGDPDGDQLIDCFAPAGFTEQDGDCDDRNPFVHPDALEGACADRDHNCDGDIGNPALCDEMDDLDFAASCGCRSHSARASAPAWMLVGSFLLLAGRRRA